MSLRSTKQLQKDHQQRIAIAKRRKKRKAAKKSRK